MVLKGRKSRLPVAASQSITRSDCSRFQQKQKKEGKE